MRLFAPGSEIGQRFEIRTLLGTGGSASVYAAWDRDLKRLVALKVLRHDRLTESVLERFRREVAVARDADSPRLVRVYDVGEASDTVFLTMELVEGETLRQKLGGALPRTRRRCTSRSPRSSRHAAATSSSRSRRPREPGPS